MEKKILVKDKNKWNQKKIKTLKKLKSYITESINENYKNMEIFNGFTTIQYMKFQKNINIPIYELTKNKNWCLELSYYLTHGVSSMLNILYKNNLVKDKDMLIDSIYNFIEFQLDNTNFLFGFTDTLNLANKSLFTRNVLAESLVERPIGTSE